MARILSAYETWKSFCSIGEIMNQERILYVSLALVMIIYSVGMWSAWDKNEKVLSLLEKAIVAGCSVEAEQ